MSTLLSSGYSRCDAVLTLKLGLVLHGERHGRKEFWEELTVRGRYGPDAYEDKSPLPDTPRVEGYRAKCGLADDGARAGERGDSGGRAERAISGDAYCISVSGITCVVDPCVWECPILGDYL